MSRHAALFLALAMVTGGAHAADGSAPAEPVRPWIDPVVSAGFERIVARCRFIYTQPLRPLQRVMLLEGDDAPATYALAGMSHDLVMTSHPVRPLLGRVMLRYFLVLKEPPADAQAQAEEARYGTRIVETLEFAWQDRRWVFRGCLQCWSPVNTTAPACRWWTGRPPRAGQSTRWRCGPAWAGYSNQGQKKNQSAA